MGGVIQMIFHINTCTKTAEADLDHQLGRLFRQSAVSDKTTHDSSNCLIACFGVREDPEHTCTVPHASTNSNANDLASL
jgi:hypothetical protein